MKNYKRTLFPYAYNILGSCEDAKDAIQDVMSDYISSKKDGIENEKGYLIKSVINRSINLKNRKKKVTTAEVWLPEPIATEKADTNINLSEIVSYSLLVLLEQLNPKERAVFILKEGFGYSHEEISEVLSTTIENSRKLLSRAKTKIGQSKKPANISENGKVTIEILEKYVDAIRGRNTKALEDLLSQDIAFYADGGGTIRVVKKICTGLHEVSDLLIFVYHRFQASYTFKVKEINHQPAIVYYFEGQVVSCQVFDTGPGGKIHRINTILDPLKIKNFERSDHLN